MNWIQGFIYGFISGLTEILPVSSQAHQRLLWQLFGCQRNPISNLIAHISVLLALYIGCRGILTRMRKDQAAMSRRRGKTHGAEIRSTYDLRLMRSALIVILLVMLALVFTRRWVDNSLLIAIFSLISGIVLFVAERFPQGNKDSRHMSVFDAVAFGLSCAMSIFPGMSRIGTSVSYATMRGVNKQQSLNWALILSIPAILILIIFDFVDIITIRGIATNFSVVLGYFTTGFGAFAGTYLCMFFVKTLINRTGLTIFAYYSWGMALLSFALYLIS